MASAEALVSSINASTPGANIEILALDLSSFGSIQTCAADFKKKSDRLDLLFLNAGVSTTAPSLTDEGYESQFGINFMGHALLTQLLMPRLLQTVNKDPNTEVRIMVTSSMAAYYNPPSTGLALSQMKNQGDPLASPYQRYAHSKLASILFARKLSQVYPSLTSMSYNPGQVKTDLFKKANGINRWLMLLVGNPFLWLTGVSVEKGAENGLWAATAKDVKNGAYYEPVGKPKDGVKYLADQHLADELWEWTKTELAAHGSPGWPVP
jgi:NAD(P)-dependent dehydrogenase (short-subunit alcohol dehydrogenase family)